MDSVVTAFPSVSVAVTRAPLEIVVAALTPALDAVQVLRTARAVNGPGPTFFTDAELVTDLLPLVLTLSGPEGGSGAPGSVGCRPPRMTAGPYRARTPLSSVAVSATAEPPGGSSTAGLALVASPGGIA